MIVTYQALPPDDELMLAIMRLTATLSLDKDCALQLLHANITDKLLNELKCKYRLYIMKASVTKHFIHQSVTLVFIDP